MRDLIDSLTAAGLEPVVIDEHTVWPETKQVDLANLQVISVTEPKATHRFDCSLCKMSIHRGDIHKKWVYKEFGEFKSVRMHLTCNP